jgi:uncharacterized protein YdaU (DUF1376 family)
MHYYSFNIEDFISHTAHLTLEEEGVYRRMLDFYYDTESPIPLKTQPVIRRLRLVNFESQFQSILDEYFIKQDDGWHNLRCDIEIADYQKKGDIARTNGKKGGRPKKNKGLKTQPVILDNPDVTQSEPRRKLTKNYKLLTNNQELIKSRGFVKPTLQELIGEFSNRVTDPEQQANKFLNHYESNGWMVGKTKMKSWKHAVTNWITRGNDNAKSGRNYQSKSDRADEALFAKYPELRSQ